MSWWLITFARLDTARYLSHLDTARALQRSFRRASIEIALSQGMRPKPALSLPLPLPVGAAGRDELAVVELVEAHSAEGLVAALREATPPGITVTRAECAGERHPRPQARRAQYTCRVKGDGAAFAAAVTRFATESHVERRRLSPKGERTLDLKEFVVDTYVKAGESETELGFTIFHRHDGAARPQEYVDLIAEWAQADASMHDLTRVGIDWQGVLRPETGRRE